MLDSAEGIKVDRRLSYGIEVPSECKAQPGILEELANIFGDCWGACHAWRLDSNGVDEVVYLFRSLDEEVICIGDDCSGAGKFSDEVACFETRRKLACPREQLLDIFGIAAGVVFFAVDCGGSDDDVRVNGLKHHDAF